MVNASPFLVCFLDLSPPRSALAPSISFSSWFDSIIKWSKTSMMLFCGVTRTRSMHCQFHSSITCPRWQTNFAFWHVPWVMDSVSVIDCNKTRKQHLSYLALTMRKCKQYFFKKHTYGITCTWGVTSTCTSIISELLQNSSMNTYGKL